MIITPLEYLKDKGLDFNDVKNLIEVLNKTFIFEIEFENIEDFKNQYKKLKNKNSEFIKNIQKTILMVNNENKNN